MGDPHYRDLPNESLTLAGCLGSHSAPLLGASRDTATYCTRCSCTTIRIKWAYGRKNLLPGKKKVKTNIAGKWFNLGRVVCESVDTAMPNRRMKSKGPPWGGWQVLGVQTTPGFCLKPNIQLPVSTDVGISCKDYVNKVPHLEESVLLTRSERTSQKQN